MMNYERHKAAAAVRAAARAWEELQQTHARKEAQRRIRYRAKRDRENARCRELTAERRAARPPHPSAIRLQAAPVITYGAPVVVRCSSNVSRIRAEIGRLQRAGLTRSTPTLDRYGKTAWARNVTSGSSGRYAQQDRRQVAALSVPIRVQGGTS